MNLTDIQKSLMRTVGPVGLTPPWITTAPGSYGEITCTYRYNNNIYTEIYSPEDLYNVSEEIDTLKLFGDAWEYVIDAIYDDSNDIIHYTRRNKDCKNILSGNPDFSYNYSMQEAEGMLAFIGSHLPRLKVEVLTLKSWVKIHVKILKGEENQSKKKKIKI